MSDIDTDDIPAERAWATVAIRKRIEASSEAKAALIAKKSEEIKEAFDRKFDAGMIDQWSEVSSEDSFEKIGEPFKTVGDFDESEGIYQIDVIERRLYQRDPLQEIGPRRRFVIKSEKVDSNQVPDPKEDL